MLTVGSLFAGIGGFDLGLERAGFTIRWQCEIDPWCRRVLTKHWPNVKRYGDITGTDWTAVETVDLVCGGFPCQPFSTASHGRRTACNLWPEMFRAVEILKPAWVIVENVVGAANLVLHEVATDLESLGYEVAPPLEIPACAVGLDHWRPRYWVLAYAHAYRKSGVPQYAEVAQLSRSYCYTGGVGAANGVSQRMDRLRGLGNAIVPQIAEWLGRQIINAQEDTHDQSRTREAGTVFS